MTEQIDAVLQGKIDNSRNLANEAESVSTQQSEILLYQRIRQSGMFLLQLNLIHLETDC